MSVYRIVGARIIDPARGVDQRETLWVVGGQVAGYGLPPAGCEHFQTIDADGLVLLPALTDIGVGFASESTAVALPEGDRPAVGWWQTAALSGGVTRVAGPAGAGHGLSCLRDFAALRAAAQTAADHGGRLWVVPTEAGLARGGVMAEGPYALRLGLNGVPAGVQAAAIGAIAQALHDTGARAHIASLATAQAVEALRDARAGGLSLTCDVQAHHLHLTDVDVGYFDTRHKLDPPLYGAADRDALRAALRAGEINAVVSGHVSVSAMDKARFFADALAGAPALGTTLSLMFSLAQQMDWPLLDALAPVTAGPQAVLMGTARGLALGAAADFCLVDLDGWWQPAQSVAMMQPALSPFAQSVLPGRVQATYVDGVRIWESRA